MSGGQPEPHQGGRFGKDRCVKFLLAGGSCVIPRFVQHVEKFQDNLVFFRRYFICKLSCFLPTPLLNILLTNPDLHNSVYNGVVPSEV